MTDSWQSRLRELVGSLDLQPSVTDALTLRGVLNDLRDRDWQHRVAILEASPELLAPSVFQTLDSDDPVLALFIERACEVGLAQATLELPTARALEAWCGDNIDALLSEVDSALAVIDSHDAAWLIPIVRAVIAEAAETDAGRACGELHEANLAALVRELNLSGEDMDTVVRLAETDWEDVWSELPDLLVAPGLDLLQRAAGGLVEHAELFYPGAPEQEYADDLNGLLLAATHSVTAATAEHRLVVRCRELAIDEADHADAWFTWVYECLRDILVAYEDRGQQWLLGVGVPLGRRACDVVPATHPDHADLMSVTSSLIAHAVMGGTAPPEDICEAVEFARRSLAGVGDKNLDVAMYQTNLGFRISTAVRVGQAHPLELLNAIALHTAATASQTGDRGRRAMRLLHLGNRIGEAVHAGVASASRMREAIDALDKAVELTALDDPDRAIFVVMRASAIGEAADAGVVDHEKFGYAIEEAESAVAAASANNARYSTLLSNLGSLISDAIKLGIADPSRMGEALRLQRRAVEASTPASADHASFQANLAIRVVESVVQGICPAVDLLEALSHASDAMVATEPTHPDWPGYASNLANVIVEAVDVGLAPMADLGVAVQLYRRVLERTPETHQLRAGRVSNLGGILAAQPDWQEYDGEALDLLHDAVRLTDARHPVRDMYLANLASGLAEAVSRAEVPAARLTDALSYAHEAVELTPEAHPRHNVNVSALATVMADAVRFDHGDRDDMLTALDLARHAVDSLSQDHPDRVRCVSNLGVMLEQAVEAGMFDGADAATAMLDLTDEFWIWARYGAGSPEQRRRTLQRTEGLVTAAVPIVLHGAGAAEAIHVAETVRDCLLTSRHAPQLPENATGPSADAYRAAAANYAAAQQRFRDGISDARDTSRAAQDLTNAITAVRQLPGLSGFASPLGIADLAQLIPPDACAIYLIAATAGGAALLLEPSGETSTVPLPAMTEQAVVDQINDLLCSPDAVTDVAQWMWAAVAEPLIRAIGTRQRWIVVPTGQTGMLPLHAAGSASDQWLVDLVDVRTLPRLSALADLPERPAAGPAIVAISHPRDLPLLSADRAAALAYLDGAIPLDTDNQGTVRDSVLEGLAEAPIAVLSGHARHSRTDGACLEFDDGPLTADLVGRLPRRDRKFAVVVACSSGQLATVLINESIGLPNALLYAGFRGVCASMWPIDDAVAFITLARLLQKHTAGTEIATDLRGVRQWLREVTAAELRAWIKELHHAVEFDGDDLRYLAEWLAPFGPKATPLNDPVHWAGFTYLGV